MNAIDSFPFFLLHYHSVPSLSYFFPMDEKCGSLVIGLLNGVKEIQREYSPSVKGLRSVCVGGVQGLSHKD